MLWLLSLVSCRTEVESPAWRDLVGYVEWGLHDWDVPGASIAVVENGKLAYSAGLGVRSLETGDPVTVDTQFRAASVTKMHTAMALLSLQEDGLVDPMLPITAQIPELALASPFQASSLTLDNLMSHASGIQTDGEETTCKEVDPDALAPFVLGEGATWVQWTPPEVLYNYANIGFAVAGLAAQEIAGEPYTQVMQERVFDPLGMDDTVFDANEASANFATGHTFDPETRELLATHTLYDRGCATEWPYGGMITTAPDLAHTVEALVDEGNPVMTPETYDAWTTGGWQFSSSSRYSYGIQVIDDYLGHQMLTHGGSMEGYLSLVAAAPDVGWGIAILVNADHSTVFPSAPSTKPTQLIFLKALSLFLGTEPDPIESTIRPPEEWSRFVGSYYEQFTYGDLTVYQEGDELHLDIADPDRRDVLLEPYSSNTFKYDRSYETSYQSAISFVMSDDGASVDWVLLENGVASTHRPELDTLVAR